MQRFKKVKSSIIKTKDKTKNVWKVFKKHVTSKVNEIQIGSVESKRIAFIWDRSGSHACQAETEEAGFKVQWKGKVRKDANGATNRINGLVVMAVVKVIEKLLVRREGGRLPVSSSKDNEIGRRTRDERCVKMMVCTCRSITRWSLIIWKLHLVIGFRKKCGSWSAGLCDRVPCGSKSNGRLGCRGGCKSDRYWCCCVHDKAWLRSTVTVGQVNFAKKRGENEKFEEAGREEEEEEEDCGRRSN